MTSLFVFDLDGTVLQTGEMYPAEALAKAVNDLRNHQCTVCVASGRSYPSLRTILKDFPDDLIFICDDGALTVKNNRTLHSAPLGKHLVSQLSQKITKLQLGAVYSHKYSADLIGFESEQCKSLQEAYLGDTKISTGVDYFRDTYKISVPFLSAMEKNVLSSNLPYGVRISYDRSDWLEFSTGFSNKGIALQKLMRDLHVSGDDAVVVGNGINDIPMFRLCKYSYAMANSPAEVLCSAYERCDDILAFLRSL